MLSAEEENLKLERERLRNHWKRTSPMILAMGALIITAGVLLIQNTTQAEEFGVVFILLGVCIVLVGLQYCHNICSHKENSVPVLRQTEV